MKKSVKAGIIDTIAVVGSLAIGFFAYDAFAVGPTFVISLIIGYFAAKFRPAAPLYLAVAAMPGLIGLFTLAEDGNSWEKLMQQTAAFVMFMIIIGGFSLIRNWLLRDKNAAPVERVYKEVVIEEDFDEFDDGDDVVFEHEEAPRTKPAYSHAPPLPDEELEDDMPTTSLKPIRKVEVTPSKHFVDLRQASPSSEGELLTHKPTPIQRAPLPRKRRQPQARRPIPVTRLEARPAPKPKIDHLTDLRDPSQVKKRRKPRNLVSG